eukprot:Sspe_Gene.22365::Locus_8494_Transcript_1_1_Confidence_1.000_Length_1333::g.22365::m.22365
MYRRTFLEKRTRPFHEYDDHSATGPLTCFYCHGRGHSTSDCRIRRREAREFAEASRDYPRHEPHHQRHQRSSDYNYNTPPRKRSSSFEYRPHRQHSPEPPRAPRRSQERLPSHDRSNDVCFSCGGRGHWSTHCPTRRNTAPPPSSTAPPPHNPLNYNPIQAPHQPTPNTQNTQAPLLTEHNNELRTALNTLTQKVTSLEAIIQTLTTHVHTLHHAITQNTKRTRDEEHSTRYDTRTRASHHEAHYTITDHNRPHPPPERPPSPLPTPFHSDTDLETSSTSSRPRKSKSEPSERTTRQRAYDLARRPPKPLPQDATPNLSAFLDALKRIPPPPGTPNDVANLFTDMHTAPDHENPLDYTNIFSILNQLNDDTLTTILDEIHQNLKDKTYHDLTKDFKTATHSLLRKLPDTLQD